MVWHRKFDFVFKFFLTEIKLFYTACCLDLKRVIVMFNAVKILDFVHLRNL